MTSHTSENKKTIARNTLLLYFRMLVAIFIGLYTSRVVLQTLGDNDYGTYNVVGGFVLMLAYLNSVFTSATQRFLSFALGRGDGEKLHRVFCTAFTLHCALAVFVFVLAETFGLWFVNNCLVIDPERMVAANWVFQFSVFALLVNIVFIPFNASIVAHERMKVFAYISILDVVMKLAIVFVLLYAPGDKLINYALLMALVALVVNLSYVGYCYFHFSETRIEFIVDRQQIREMAAYVGWTSVGTLGFTFKDQMANVILNLFLGTAVNAARGIAMQVSNLTNQFAQNFFMAVQPQIIKLYAVGKVEDSRALVYQSAKLAFFLMGVITIPLILSLRYLLELWLDHVPEFTYEFLCIILVSSLIATLAASTTTAIQATGRIRTFQILISLLFLSELPMAYVLLEQGYAPYVAVMPCVVTQTLGIFLRFFLLSRLVEAYRFGYFMVHVVLRSVAVVALAALLCAGVNYFLPTTGFLIFCGVSLVYVVVTVAIVYTLGLTPGERAVVRTYGAKVLAKLHR